MESEDFERVLPAALKFSKTHDLPCRILKNGDLYSICFQDKAVSRGIVYSHLHEKEMEKNFGKYAIIDVYYVSQQDFEQGICCNQDQ